VVWNTQYNDLTWTATITDNGNAWLCTTQSITQLLDCCFLTIHEQLLMQAEGYYLFTVVLIGTHSGITALVATLTRIQPNARYVGGWAQCNDVTVEERGVMIEEAQSEDCGRGTSSGCGSSTINIGLMLYNQTWGTPHFIIILMRTGYNIVYSASKPCLLTFLCNPYIPFQN